MRLSRLLLLTLALAMSACAPPAPSSGDNSLTNTRWLLVSFGAPGAESQVVEGTSVTLEFGADGQAGGSGGCNSYGGAYQVQGNTLTFGELTSTLRACVDERGMQQETDYFEALQSAGTFELTGNQLAIAYDAGRGVLSFVKASN